MVRDLAYGLRGQVETIMMEYKSHVKKGMNMEQKILTLQEKMVKIRSEIPALVKRAYSEDVNYDFIKIDDIFRYLTPAMNRWNVNFEIVSECASKRNENGDSVYVEFLAYCQMWLYEADLELKWINAEKPEDEVTVTIHAIGTHEMPEKTKGSALTYAMKYYLMDKYCIDRGGVDPDMRDFPPDTYDGSIPEYDGLSSDAYDFSDRDSEGIAGDASGITDMELDAEMEGGQEVPRMNYRRKNRWRKLRRAKLMHLKNVP